MVYAVVLVIVSGERSFEEVVELLKLKEGWKRVLGCWDVFGRFDVAMIMCASNISELREAVKDFYTMPGVKTETLIINKEFKRLQIPSETQKKQKQK